MSSDVESLGGIMPSYITRSQPDDNLMPTNAPCERCASRTDVIAVGCVQGETASAPGVLAVVCLCAHCLAQAIERVTGFRVVAALDSWYAVRESAVFARERARARRAERNNKVGRLD
jgi:hypothetical protein